MTQAIHDAMVFTKRHSGSSIEIDVTKAGIPSDHIPKFWDGSAIDAGEIVLKFSEGHAEISSQMPSTEYNEFDKLGKLIAAIKRETAEVHA